MTINSPFVWFRLVSFYFCYIMGLLSSDVEKIEIKFDQDGRPYLAGDVVSGTFEVTFKKDVKINSVTMSAYVDTNVKFSIHTKKGNQKRNPTAHHHHNFAKDEILEHEMEVPQGMKVWNFSFTLDKDLRSSFTGNHGSTKYFVKAHVDLPGFDKEETAEFYVNHYRNLNMIKKSLEKAENHTSTTFGFLCCETGPLSLNYSINKTGFVCGEKAIVNVKIDNVSGKEVKDVSIILQQEIKYHGVYKPPRPRAGGVKAKKGKKAKKTIRARAKVVPKQQGDIKKTKSETKTISCEVIGTAGGNETKNFDKEFTIPEVPSSHVDTDGIGIIYYLKVEACADAFLGDVSARTAVTIGNIPHKSAYTQWAAENMYEMREEIKESYPTIPNYNGEKYIFYETAKVREGGGEIEDAKDEKDPVFGDDGVPSDSDSSDDSSDSDDGGGGDDGD